MLCRIAHITVLSLALSFTGVMSSGAPPRDMRGADIPIAGPPPQGDYLPPPSEEQRARASLQMLVTVAAGLAAIFVLLRWFVKPDRRAIETKTPEQALVERAEELLDKRDDQEGL